MNSLVALPIAASVPTAAPAMTSDRDDPVFQAIGRHQQAVKASKVAAAETARILSVVEGELGPCGISILDMRESSDGFHNLVSVNCWIEIEKYVCPSTRSELYYHYKERLANHRQRWNDRADELAGGDIDAIGTPHYDEEADAANALSETAPTSMAGLLALLMYVEKAQRHDDSFFEVEHYDTMFRGMKKLVKAISNSRLQS